MASAKAAVDEAQILKSIEPFSKALQKTVGQIWKMFVMRYVAKGLGEIFLAVFVTWIGWYFLRSDHRLWMLPFFIVSGVFIYDAIQLLINPWYFAMNDVAVRLKSEQLFLKKR
jgi:hypothetical protein